MKIIMVLIVVFMLGACSVNPRKQQGQNQAYATTLPAVVFCFLAVCESQFNDRAEKAFLDKSGNDSDADLGTSVEKPETTKGVFKK